MLGDDREEDLEDVSGLLDNCISVARGAQFGDLFDEFVAQRRPKSSVSSALTSATRPALRMMLGMPSRTSLPTKCLPLARMRWCSSTAGH